MKVIHVTKPAFDFEGERLYVQASRWKTLRDFQDEMDRKQKLGATICFFYSMYTQYDPNYPEPEHILYWIRCLFYKQKSTETDKSISWI
jgi:hypothetical protein